MNDSFLLFNQDQFSCLGPVQIRKMFGGAGISLGGLTFGLVVEDTVYLKVDATNKADFEDLGMGPFTYEGKGKSVSMSYYQLPEEILSDLDELLPWAEKALKAAESAKKPSKRKK